MNNMYEWQINTWKKCWISLVIKETWIKTTMSYHYTYIRIDQIKKSNEIIGSFGENTKN